MCPGQKKDQKYLLLNKFAHIAIIFVKQHRECSAELIVEQISTSPNHRYYFALQNVMVAMLLHHNARKDSMQEQAYI